MASNPAHAFPAHVSAELLKLQRNEGRRDVGLERETRLSPPTEVPASESAFLRRAGLADLASRRLRSGLKACRSLRKELSAVSRPSQRGPLLLPTQSADVACPICSNLYDCVLSLPLCLPCGHTLCSACVLMLTQRTSLCCPFDRSKFDTDSSPLPTNLLLANFSTLLLDSAQCPTHHSPVVAYCLESCQLLCGFCEHQGCHTHVLLDSGEAVDAAQRQMWALSQQLTLAWGCLKQVTNWAMEVESLLLKLTVKFNGFSLLLRATKDDKRKSKQFAETLLKLRAELEECQKSLQIYVQTHWCIYWNSGRMLRWQLLSYRFPSLPAFPSMEKYLEATQKWLSDVK